MIFPSEYQRSFNRSKKSRAGSQHLGQSQLLRAGLQLMRKNGCPYAEESLTALKPMVITKCFTSSAQKSSAEQTIFSKAKITHGTIHSTSQPAVDLPSSSRAAFPWPVKHSPRRGAPQRAASNPAGVLSTFSWDNADGKAAIRNSYSWTEQRLIPGCVCTFVSASCLSWNSGIMLSSRQVTYKYEKSNKKGLTSRQSFTQVATSLNINEPRRYPKQIISSVQRYRLKLDVRALAGTTVVLDQLNRFMSNTD